VTEKLKSATVIIGEMMVAVIIGDEVTAGTKGMLAYSALGFLNCYHMLLCYVIVTWTSQTHFIY
jgi:hypothetical protein